MKKPTFRVGQLVVDQYGRITKIAAIDPDGTLYELCVFLRGTITKISNVRPLTAREIGKGNQS